MNLWIRTQGNDLCKVEDIVEPTCYDNKNWHLSAYTSRGRFVTLGIYETEKRALEVLDEINNVKYYKYLAELNFDNFIKVIQKYSEKEKNILLSGMNTYDMPKE